MNLFDLGRRHLENYPKFDFKQFNYGNSPSSEFQIDSAFDFYLHVFIQLLCFVGFCFAMRQMNERDSFFD